MEQIPISEFFAEKPVTEVPELPKSGQFFLLTAVLKIDEALATYGYEWHEKYIARLPSYCDDHERLLEELIKCHQFKHGVVVKTGSGKRIKIGSAQIFFTQQKIQTTLAKLMVEHKILPLLTIKELREAA